MRKLLIIIACFALFYFIDVSKLNKNNKRTIIKEIVYLEKKYNNKLLKKYNIDPDELEKTCSSSKKIPKCKKEYIIKNTSLTEKEYQDIFIHPLEQIKNTKDHIENTYENLIDTINNLSELIDTLDDLN